MNAIHSIQCTHVHQLNAFRRTSLHSQSFSKSLFKTRRRYSTYVTQNDRPFRMAVIGSGPAGFYTAYKVMSGIENAAIDMYEHLPVPYGLVRFGVAPDHPEVKNCEVKFAEVASSPRFNFIGNVDVGKDIWLSSLKHHYDAILFAYGASKDRKLGVPGEDRSKGIYSARAFVGWYNGLPEYTNLNPNLEAGEEAIVIGQGNVALDVARILLTDVNDLRKTDITDNALAALSKSKVRRVRVVGRRGPMQASFTIKEVRELMKLPFVAFSPIEPSLFPPETSKLQRKSRRLTELLKKGTTTAQSEALKSWSLDFFLSPVSFNSNANSGVLSNMAFVKTTLDGRDPFDPSTRVISTTNHVNLPASIAFRSIGYKSEPLPGMEDLGIHFDEGRGIIPNDYFGRVVTPTSGSEPRQLPGFYCSGWVKSGPNGVIANTMEDAFATARAIVDDWKSKKPFLVGGHGWDALREDVEGNRLRSVSWKDWLKIDAAEKARGERIGKEREKFVSVEEMLQVLEK